MILILSRYGKVGVVSLILIALLFSGRSFAQESKVLTLVSRSPLPNVKGRIDHFSADVQGQRLFVAAVENHTVEVIDLKTGKVVRTVKDLAEPQGVYYGASTNHLFVACGLDGVTKILDGTTFQTISTVKFPDDADNIRYARAARK